MTELKVDTGELSRLAEQYFDKQDEMARLNTEISALTEKRAAIELEAAPLSAQLRERLTVGSAVVSRGRVVARALSGNLMIYTLME